MRQFIKILLIILIIAGAGIGGYFAWRYFFGAAGPGNNGTGGEPSGTSEELAIAKPVVMLDRPIFDYWLNKKSGDTYYILPEGEIRKISPTGDDQETGSRATGNLSHIKPSANGSKIIVAFGFPQSPTFAIYDTASKSWHALPSGTTAADWDPASDNRIAYLKDNGNGGRLYFFTLNNSRSTEVLRIAQKDLDLNWQSSDLLYLSERPSDKIPGLTWSYNLKTRNFRSATDDLNSVLTKANLKTLATKCAPLSDFIYCAVPVSRANQANFIDNYYKKALNTEDEFYVVSTSGFPIKIPAEISEPIDAEKLTAAENYLLFINRYDQKLYKLEL